jgi:hypothetical protein
MIQRIVAIVLFGFCAAYTYGATHLSMGALTAPKAGFVPVIIGVCGTLLSGVLAVQSLMTPAGGLPAETHPGRALLFVAGLFGYAALLGFAGFLPATFLGTLFLLKISGVAGWPLPLIIAGGGAVLLDGLFEYVLEISLP